MSNQSAAIILTALFLHYIFSLLFNSHFSKQPLNESIDLTHTLSESFDIYIPMHQKYLVCTTFDINDIDPSYFKKAISNITNPSENSLPLNIKWNISNSKDIIKSDEMLFNTYHTYSKDSISRCVGNFKVPSGDYKFNVEIINPPNGFSKLNTKLVIKYKSKDGETWHSTYMFWAMLFNYFVAKLIAGVILLLLMYRYINHLIRTKLNVKTA